ncbi:PQQ-dependent sugar dehydrogenase [Pseudarthrobacter sp. P1]|uniref:PQQ-dependent sugar dehydrogenase n=1 Tax=Pseudarthrobacter sp. P1 TaxID=3418418 RepID=UPI003CF4A3FF
MGGLRTRANALVAAAAAVACFLAACAPPTDGPQPAPVAASDVATGLAVPWSMAALPDGSVLVSERGTARVLELLLGGATRVAGTLDGVVPGGEGGLLGLAVRPGCGPGPQATETGCATLYAYLTAAGDNRIVRLPVTGAAGSQALGSQQTVFTGIAKAGNHNGGRIAFGPDGCLYATAGDAGNRASAQDPRSLNGKILRLTPDGGIPADNPFPGSPVYSLGHRNPQGLAWDGQGRLWASEFGQDTWDELNLIVPGHNYGWPQVEGMGGGPGFTDPVLAWHTGEASPSGIAIAGSTLYMASLRGARLWVVSLPGDGGTPARRDAFVGTYGRLRDVRLAADGTLWLLTNNTDGRGSPRQGDDRIVSVPPPAP